MKRSLFSLIGLMAVALATVAVMAPPAAASGLFPLMAGTTPDHWAALAFGGLVITPANMQMLNQGFKAAFKGSFEMTKPMWNQIAMKVPSTTGEEKYAWLGATTKLREWIGDRGIAIGIDRFGASAPGELVLEKLGISSGAVVAAVKRVVAAD